MAHERGQAGAERRVVVCSVGAVTSHGPTAADLWAGVSAGRVAIRPVRQLPMDGYRTRLGGEVLDRRPPRSEYRRPPGVREPVIDFALRAAEEALDGCDGLRGLAGERWGVVVGTCNAGLVSARAWYAARLAGGRPDRRLLLLVSPQAIAEALGGAFGLTGPCLSVNTACAAGAHAIGCAADLIRDGHADAVLAGGSDAFSDVLFSGFNALESLSPEPAAPYSRDRSGLSLGEGSGMLVLAAADVAAEVGAPVLAEVLGYGASADGFHPTAPHPDGEGASRAIGAALANAGVAATEVGYVNTHGTGTAKNDVAETRANRRALGDRALFSSTKSMIGHLLGAAGAVEGVVTVKALEHQLAPPTANYREPDPDCGLDFVPNAPRPMAADVAVSNNFAFAGANASLVLARPGARSAVPQPELDAVVVTGLGTLTTAGCEPSALWRAFADGRDCVGVEHGVRLGRVPLDLAAAMSPRERRRLDRLAVFAVTASRLALEDAELVGDARRDAGVALGTGVGPMESIERFAHAVIESGPGAANPAVFPNTVYNAAAGQVAIHLGTVGPTATLTAGHAAGASALAHAYDVVARGRAEAMLAVAVDTLTPTVVEGYRALGLLDGDMALAEAGVALLLERRSHALARGARIYGELRGYGVACDGRGIGGLDPDGGASERAMRAALARARLDARDLVAVWSGIAGHPVADAAERAAIARVAGPAARVLEPKLALGEPMGAGGALGAALALHEPSGPALVNSASLGGTSYSLIVAPAGVA